MKLKEQWGSEKSEARQVITSSSQNKFKYVILFLFDVITMLHTFYISHSYILYIFIFCNV